MLLSCDWGVFGNCKSILGPVVVLILAKVFLVWIEKLGSAGWNLIFFPLKVLKFKDRFSKESRIKKKNPAFYIIALQNFKYMTSKKSTVLFKALKSIGVRNFSKSNGRWRLKFTSGIRCLNIFENQIPESLEGGEGSPVPSALPGFTEHCKYRKVTTDSGAPGPQCNVWEYIMQSRDLPK